MADTRIEDALTAVKACLLKSQTSFADFIAIWADMNKKNKMNAAEVKANYDTMRNDFIGWFNALDEEQQVVFVKEALAPSSEAKEVGDYE